MADYFNGYAQPGNFFGSIYLQASANIGGNRSVFVDTLGIKDQLDMPSWGGQLQNPFNVPAKFFAGDLFELRFDEKGEDPKLYLLKTFKAKSASGTTVVLYRSANYHVPCVGDIIMKAPETIGGQGKAHAITNVVAGNDGTDDIWTVTVKAALDTISKNDVLVEGDAESDTANMLVKTINTVAPSDGDFVYMPTTNVTTKTNSARMFYTPVMGGKMYIHKMSPLPKCVLALNKSRFNGWYEV